MLLKMVENQALNCYSGKQIPCEIDSICVHGDGKSAVNTAKRIKEGLDKIWCNHSKSSEIK